MFKFTISPRNTEKILDKLSKKFEIFDAEKSEEKVTFTCHNKDRKKIKKSLKFWGIQNVECKPIKTSSILNQFTSIGILCGIVFCAVVWFVSSFFITDVIIMGDIDFTEQEVYNVLKENNIHKFILKSKIDKKNLENQIQNIPYISYVSIIFRGNALLINIREQLTNVEIVNSGTFMPIVSIYDCTITSIKLIQGTLAVKAGDTIQAGDVLVYPYSTDSQGNTRSVQPLADIVADVYITSDLVVYDKQIEQIFTGNVIKNYEITFLGLPLYKKENEVDFLKYTTKEYTVDATTTLLPIKINYKNYYEYEEKIKYSNFNENLDYYIDKTRQTALLNVKDYDIIKGESHVVREYDGYHVVEYSLTISKKIV